MNSRKAKPQISEFSLIRKYFAPFASKGAFSLQDDAAEIIPQEGMSLVITQDAISEGIHFFKDDAPSMIAKKALRVNLSDLAAKGAKPKYISLALGLGASWTESWVAEFAKSLHEDCQAFDLQLTGGDTFKTGGGFTISITAIGELLHNQYVSRLGAEPENILYVTGTIGDAALGLRARKKQFEALSDYENQYLIDRYLIPQPRVGASKTIRQFATASMDVSDGLVGDLEKLCSASDVSAEIVSSEIPVSQAVQSLIQSESNSLQTALTGGDDYEILFTINPADCHELEKAVSALPFEVTRIGKINSGQGVKVFDTDGQLIEFEQTSYDHSGESS